jgi:hypothetical protein
MPKEVLSGFFLQYSVSIFLLWYFFCCCPFLCLLSFLWSVNGMLNTTWNSRT